MASHTFWTCYLTFRLLLGTFDFITDFIQGVSLAHLGHTFWSIGTFAFPLVAVLIAMLSVVVGRFRHGHPMSKSKFLLLSLKTLTALCEGLFESGPELVLQMVVVVHGVHIEDLVILFDREHRWSWPWFRGVVHVVGIVNSFVSLVVTVMYYNEEKPARGPGHTAKFLLALTFSIFSVGFRVWVAAILFSAAPWIAFTLCVAIYVFNVISMTCGRYAWDVTILASYVSFFCPAGFSKNHGHHNIQQPSLQRRMSFSEPHGRTHSVRGLRDSTSEVERAKIIQESLYKRVKISLALHTLTSLLLLIPYAVILELFIFQENHHSDKILPSLTTRPILYTIPSVMFFLTSILLWFYTACIRQSRDAAREWYRITPHRSRTPSRSAASTLNRISRSDNNTANRTLNLNEFGDVVSGTLDSANSEASTVLIRPSAPRPQKGDSLDKPEEKIPQGPKTPPPPYNPEYLKSSSGMRKCDKTCALCDFVLEGNNFTSMVTGKKYRQMTPVTCDTNKVIYLVSILRSIYT